MLVLEHDAAIRRFVAAVLRLAGHDVTEVGTADEALRRVGAGGVKAVVCDHNPKGMPGGDFVRHLRSRFDTARTPIVVLVSEDALDRRVDALEALEAGADHYVLKPVDGEILVAKLQAAIRPRDAAPG